MGPSYDAQRNEFCAYVLHESETPYGLLLGNFKTFAQSTAKGGVRGLWDADTDQIIFGMHHIAYRLRGSDDASHALSASDRARSHVSAVRADLGVHARATACTSPRRFTFRTAPSSIARSRSSSTSRCTTPGARTDRGRALSRGRCWSGSASTANPSTRSAPGTTGASSVRRIRNRRRALVGRFAPAGRRRALAARTGAARSDAARDLAAEKTRAPRRRHAGAGRAGEPPYLRRVRVRDRGRARGARVAAAWRSSTTRTGPQRAARVLEALLKRPARAARYAALLRTTVSPTRAS